MKGLFVAWGGWSGEEKLLSSCSLVVYNMVKIDFIYCFLPRWGPIKTRDGCSCEVWKILTPALAAAFLKNWLHLGFVALICLGFGQEHAGKAQRTEGIGRTGVIWKENRHLLISAVF